MESKEAPKKKTKPNSLSLPDDVLLIIFAKVSRNYYPLLSLVSKNFRSLIGSRDLFTVRSSLGTAENTVFVCLKLPTSENLRWYNLWKNPNNGSKHFLVPINNSYERFHSTSVVFLDSICYVIGGHDEFSCTVKRYCRKTSSFLPENAPNMNVVRKNAVVCQYINKIYVMGGCNFSETTNWAEVFDIKTQTWKSFTCPDVLRRYKIYKIKGLHTKLYVWTDTKDYSYDVNGDKWEVLEERLSRSKTWCVVGGIVYHLDHFEGFTWFNSPFGIWRKVKGLSKFNYKCGITKGHKGMIEMIEHEKKLLVFWDKFETSGRGSVRSNKIIKCAKISLLKTYGDINGKVEWKDDVITVPSTYDFVTCLCKPV